MSTTTIHSLITVDEAIVGIIKSLRNQDTIVFCGAGLSFNSGLPLANQLMAEVMDQLPMSEVDRLHVLNYSMPFEAFIQILQKATDIAPLLEIFDIGKPNTNHYLLAWLMKLGFLTNVVTTNFDQLIERALEQCGCKVGKDYDVVYKDSELENINWGNTKPRLVKIHGSCEDKSGLAITIEKVAGGLFVAPRMGVLDHVLSTGPQRNVIFLGYSVSDVFDVNVCLKSIKYGWKNIFLVEHSTNCKVEYVGGGHDDNPFEKFPSGCRISFDTNQLVKIIWNEFGAAIGGPYSYIAEHGSLWKECVLAWIRKAKVDHTDSICLSIIGDLLLRVDKPIVAKHYYEEALANVRRARNTYEELCALTDLGVVNATLAHFSFELPHDAITIVENAINLARLIEKPIWEAKNLANLGNIYLCHCEVIKKIGIGSLETSALKAVDYYTLACRILAAYKDKKTEGGVLGNLGNAFGTIGRYSDQIECGKNAVAIAHEVGDVLGEGGNLVNLAFAYMKTQQLEKAVPCLRKAADLFLRMRSSDNVEICTMLLEEVVSRFGKYKVAKIEYEEAFEEWRVRLKVAENANDKRTKIRSRVIIAYAERALGQYQQAMDSLCVEELVENAFLEDGAALLKRISDEKAEIDRMLTALDPGMRVELIDVFRQSVRQIELARAMGTREAEVRAIISTGRIYAQFHFFSEAVSFFQHGHRLGVEAGSIELEFESLGNLAAAYHNLGLFPDALACYEKVLAIIKEHPQDGYGIMLEQIKRNQAETSKVLGFYVNVLHVTSEDFNLVRKALECYVQGVMRVKQIMRIGGKYLESGDTSRAIAAFTMALDIVKWVRNGMLRRDLLNRLAKANYQSGRLEAAIGFLEEILKDSKAIEDNLGMADALGNLGSIYDDMGVRARAFECHQQAYMIYASVLSPENAITKQEWECVEAAKRRMD